VHPYPFEEKEEKGLVAAQSIKMGGAGEGDSRVIGF
jgi:hypothetical protein